MLVPLLLLLALVPFIELAILIRLYQATDLLTTLALVIGAGILGAAIAKWQGFEVWRRIQSQLAQGKTPTNELLDGLMIMAAGALLIIPGILTDALGFLLLLPPVRGFLRGWLARRLIPPGAIRFTNFGSSDYSESRKSNGNEIEAEYTVEPSDPSAPQSRLPKSTD